MGITTITGAFTGNGKYWITVQAKEQKNCDLMIAKIESSAKLYLGNFRYPVKTGSSNYNSVFRIASYGINAPSGCENCVIIELIADKNFKYMHDHLGAVPSLGATFPDVERVFQTVPSVNQGIEARAAQEVQKVRK